MDKIEDYNLPAKASIKICKIGRDKMLKAKEMWKAGERHKVIRAFLGISIYVYNYSVRDIIREMVKKDQEKIVESLRGKDER